MKKGFYFIFFALIIVNGLSAQVGIGTETPEISSILDVTSEESGVLLPRMTTVQRTAIPTPANGLTVFDTDEQSYFFYNETESTWESLSSSRLERDNYVLVKSQDDLPDDDGTTITLDENTYYEINGIITLDLPINLNGAYVAGLDADEDMLSRASGNVFEGSGGSIRNITITGGGDAFNITSGASLLVQNTIITGMGNVGTISGLGFVFLSDIQYLNNNNGIIYSNILNLALNNQAWLDSNSGTFEKFKGTFHSIIKESGFSNASNGVSAIDVSDNPEVSIGVIQGTVFSGTSTIKIKKYDPALNNENFTKDWFVQAPGIRDEYDDIATGNIYSNNALDEGYGITSAAVNTPFKLTGGSVTSNLLRFSSDANNRLRYEGKEAKTFSLKATLSVRGTNRTGEFYSFFIRVNGNESLNRTNAIFYVENTTNVSSISLSGTVTLSPNDFVEIWCQKLTGTQPGNLTIFSQNLNIN